MNPFSILFISIVIDIPLVLMSGFTLSVLWSWFIVPLFPVEELTLIQAMGLGMVISYTSRNQIKKPEDVDYVPFIFEHVVSSFMRSLSALAFGWAYTLFI